MHDIQHSGKLTIYFIKNSAMYSVLVDVFFYLFSSFITRAYTRALSPILLGWSLLLFV